MFTGRGKMRFFKWFAVLAGGFSLFTALIPCFAQKAEVDSILPPDHLLENLPWWAEGGKAESKGLFSFEELGGPGSKNLLFVYRPAAPVAELDKPHTQTLAVCLYNAVSKKYVKHFEDEGGPIQWIKILKDVPRHRAYLLVERDDLKGSQVIKGFLEVDGQTRQVMEALAPQAFARFPVDPKELEVWCSAKAYPRSRNEAEHVFAWNEDKFKFQDAKVTAGNPGNWVGFSILIPTPVVVARKTGGQPQLASAKARKPKGELPTSLTSWWDKPLNPTTAFQQLKGELVPQSIEKKQVVKLGQMANAFFQEAQKQGVRGKEFMMMRAEYYAAVASAFAESGDKAQARYYLGVAMKIQSNDPEVLQAKQKLGGSQPTTKSPDAERPSAAPEAKEAGTPPPPAVIPGAGTPPKAP